ncbi:MAG: hypothetical protein ACM32O_14700 [Clostridia bacterium]
MLQKMYGMEMNVPAGKLPGFYAQLIHKIGDRVEVFDRDQTMFILDKPEQREILRSLLAPYNMVGEEYDLWLLSVPVPAEEIVDYGFVSQAEHAYLFADTIDIFRFDSTKGSAEDRWAALQQMQEHIIISLPESVKETLYLIDKNYTDLIGGIANAYAVGVDWIKL